MLHLGIRTRDLMTQSKKRVKSLTNKATKAWNLGYWLTLLCSYTILWLAVLGRYNEPLRTTYRKLRISFPKMAPTLILYLCVKAMNDTIGPEGLAPSSLVFGEMPSVRMINEPLIQKSKLSERNQAAMEARKEMVSSMEKIRIKRGTTHNVSAPADKIVHPVIKFSSGGNK